MSGLYTKKFWNTYLHSGKYNQNNFLSPNVANAFGSNFMTTPIGGAFSRIDDRNTLTSTVGGITIKVADEKDLTMGNAAGDAYFKVAASATAAGITLILSLIHI